MTAISNQTTPKPESLTLTQNPVLFGVFLGAMGSFECAALAGACVGLLSGALNANESTINSIFNGLIKGTANATIAGSVVGIVAAPLLWQGSVFMSLLQRLDWSTSCQFLGSFICTAATTGSIVGGAAGNATGIAGGLIANIGILFKNNLPNLFH